jgi:hypothetical protein
MDIPIRTTFPNISTYAYLSIRRHNKYIHIIRFSSGFAHISFARSQTFRLICWCSFFPPAITWSGYIHVITPKTSPGSASVNTTQQCKTHLSSLLFSAKLSIPNTTASPNIYIYIKLFLCTGPCHAYQSIMRHQSSFLFGFCTPFLGAHRGLYPNFLLLNITHLFRPYKIFTFSGQKQIASC